MKSTTITIPTHNGVEVVFLREEEFEWEPCVRVICKNIDQVFSKEDLFDLLIDLPWLVDSYD